MPKQETQEAKYVQGGICPHCYRYLPYPVVHEPYQAKGRTWRLVQGWCFDCQKGAILMQTPGMSGRWIVHQYLPYDLVHNVPVPTDSGQWVLMTPLPPESPKADDEGPVLKFGQGDYAVEVSAENLDKALRIELAAMVELIQVVLNAVKSIVTAKLKKNGLDNTTSSRTAEKEPGSDPTAV
ncbi:MAG TPA: hypothetical protein PKY88_12550 [Anaerohalosphaeraceae bacterium]|nr:hypothetical protein [Anaerohalosphaeraceae bacterium]